MPKQRVENNTLYRGVSRWQNLDTGEVIETDEVIKKTGRQGFMITYLNVMLQLMDQLGTKKMKVIRYVIQNMDKSTNTFYITTNELALKVKVSKPTVLEALKALEDIDIIKRKTGVIILNPKLLHRGTEDKEKFLLARFQKF